MGIERSEEYKHFSSELVNKRTALYRTHEVIAKGRKISAHKRTGASMAKAFLKRLDTVGFNPPPPVVKRRGRPRKGGLIR